MNKTEENKICQACAKCCKSYWIFTNVPEEIERFETLTLPKDIIEVIKIKDKLWKVMFHIPCCHLKQDFDGKYFECHIYGMEIKRRPKYCVDYPRNFLEKDVEKEVLEYEKTFCPLLNKLCEVSSLLLPRLKSWVSSEQRL